MTHVIVATFDRTVDLIEPLPTPVWALALLVVALAPIGAAGAGIAALLSLLV